VASKVLDIYKDQKINEHAAAMGQHAWQRFEKEFLPLPHVGHLGGLGLMLGLEIVVDKKTKAALDPEETLNIIQDRAFKEGLYLRVMSNRICFSPPLIITKEELDNAIDRLYSIVSELKLK
jgi:adenosylmethionine-8-amino-7-oxononanoate aminotransferase